MIDLKIKEMFFDRVAVSKQADKARFRNLSKAGAYVRQRAKTSIKRRAGVSEPGSPPFSHTDLLRRWILFGYDKGSDSVLVGPVAIRSGTAPRALEVGGASKARQRGQTVPIRIKKRPYMVPALQKESKNFPGLWENSIKPT